MRCFDVIVMISVISASMPYSAAAQTPDARRTIQQVLRIAEDRGIRISNPDAMKAWKGALPAFALELVRNFDVRSTWRSIDRIGRDEDNDGHTDIPNVFSYVHNCTPAPVCDGSNPLEWDRFPVLLDLRATAPKGLFIPQDCFPCFGFEPHLSSGGEQIPVSVRASWSVRGVDGALVADRETDQAGRVVVRLQEGSYLVLPVVRVLLVGVTFELAGQALSVKVKDLLIAVIGDSYASGEGDPETGAISNDPTQWRPLCVPPGTSAGLIRRNKRVVRWGDDGSGADDAVLFESYSDGGFWASMTGSAPVLVEVRMCGVDLGEVRAVEQPTGGSAREHILAHRSSAAWPVQVALALEHADEFSSVTLVFLPASGATIVHGLVGGFESTADEIASPWVPGGSVGGQIEALRSLLGSRTIDVLLMSIGGNDIGFAEVVKVLELRRAKLAGQDWLTIPTPSLPDLAAAISTGDYRGFLDGKQTDTGLYALGSRFAYLRNRIRSVFRGQEFPILITQYPDPTTGVGGATCAKALTAFSPSLFGFNIDVEITQEELEFARTEFLQPLNAVIRHSAEELGWLTVEPRFEGHGLCAPEPYPATDYAGVHSGSDVALTAPVRWIRSAMESVAIQGPTSSPFDTKGVLHPNEIGHRAIAEQVLKVLSGALPED